MMRDPLAASLHARGIYSGAIKLPEPAVWITPGERDALCKRLEMDRLDQICTRCGSTKPMTFYLSIGAKSCCEARKMVPVSDYLAEMDALRARLAKFRKRKSRRAPK